MSKNKKQIEEQELKRRKRERIIMMITIVVIIILTVVEVYITQQDTIIPVSNNILVFGLININIILIILLIFLIVRNVVKLIFERRRGVIGSKLRTKLVAAFVGLSLIPTVLLFLVAINFLSYSIEVWFNMKIADALNKTVEIANIYYQQTADHAKYYARLTSSDITKNRLYDNERIEYLRTLIEKRQKSYKIASLEVHLQNRKENLTVREQGLPMAVFGQISTALMEDVFEGMEVSNVHSSEEGDSISGISPIYSYFSPTEVIGAVVVTYVVPKTLIEKIGVVSKTSEEYKQLSLLKNPIKFSYMITLLIITLLIIFSATWFGLFLARGITGPIQDLATATEKIAKGELDHQINIAADDEIGVLVNSFNKMTKDLKKGKESLEQANIDLDERRKYMETVLGNVSAGVVSVDRNDVITTINKAIERMLDIKSEKVLNRRYQDVLIPEHLLLVEEFLLDLKKSGSNYIERQIEIKLKDRIITVLVTITQIHDDDGHYMGMVVVFEDLTQIQKAERAAAWREVARRMAHEIKNPLTPVQLSAQRLQKKYGDKLGDDGLVFNECTRTIIDQVEILKNLVNAFSRYARLPVTNLTLNNLNEVVSDSVSLFQEVHKDIYFDLEIDPHIPEIYLDTEQIKRVMTNLLDNAVAAMDKEKGHIRIITSYDKKYKKVKVEVADNGCGVPYSYKAKMFEPYFSTKKSGTGLGLAIVSAIISDHRGHVSVKDNIPSGTIVAFELPASESGDLT